MADKKVLVLCATGKAGKGIVRGLVQRGYEVYGTTRSAKSGAVLEKLGAKPVVANYVVGADVQRIKQRLEQFKAAQRRDDDAGTAEL